MASATGAYLPPLFRGSSLRISGPTKSEIVPELEASIMDSIPGKLLGKADDATERLHSLPDHVRHVAPPTPFGPGPVDAAPIIRLVNFRDGYTGISIFSRAYRKFGPGPTGKPKHGEG